jgi:hypothetical protein
VRAVAWSKGQPPDPDLTFAALQAIRAVILTGRRARFLGGRRPSRDGVRLIVHSDKLFVAAINGAGAGVGLAFAMACDLVIASDRARLLPSAWSQRSAWDGC